MNTFLNQRPPLHHYIGIVDWFYLLVFDYPDWTYINSGPLKISKFSWARCWNKKMNMEMKCCFQSQLPSSHSSWLFQLTNPSCPRICHMCGSQICATIQNVPPANMCHQRIQLRPQMGFIIYNLSSLDQNLFNNAEAWWKSLCTVERFSR